MQKQESFCKETSLALADLRSVSKISRGMIEHPQLSPVREELGSQDYQVGVQIIRTLFEP